MFLVGSRCLGFISNPKDWDFAMSPEEDYGREIKEQRKLHNIPANSHTDCFIRKTTKMDEITYLRLIFDDIRINKYAKEELEWEKKDIPDFIKKTLLCVLDKKTNIKILYRIEILLEFLENNYVFNPTEEQKKFINDLHDCKVDLNLYIKNVAERILKLT